MRTYAIFGVGGCGRGILPLARVQLDSAHKAYRLVFVDDNSPLRECNGHEVVRYESLVACAAAELHICLAVANGVVREKLAARCSRDGLSFFQVSASNVTTMDDVSLGEGAVLSPFVTLTSNIRIGKHFHANSYSYVEHDCIIGDFVTFGPGVKCNGNVVVEDHAYIGAGAIIKQGLPGRPLVIGRGAVIGMGAVVTRDVPPETTVVGNPARILN